MQITLELSGFCNKAKRIGVIRIYQQRNFYTKRLKKLNNELNERNGELQKQYDKHNKVDNINDVVIIYKDEVPVACGAFREHNIDAIELKRIFVKEENRRQGLSKGFCCK